MPETRQITMTPEWLDGLGYTALPLPYKYSVLREAYKALEQKVGEALTATMSEKLLDEFGAYVDNPNAEIAERGAEQWLEKNAPGYRGVVLRVWSELEGVLRNIAVDFSRQRQHSVVDFNITESDESEWGTARDDTSIRDSQADERFGEEPRADGLDRKGEAYPSNSVAPGSRVDGCEREA